MAAYGIDNGFGNTKTPCYCFYQQNPDYGVIKKPTFIVMLSCVQSDKGHNLVLLMKNQGVINIVMFRTSSANRNFHRYREYYTHSSHSFISEVERNLIIREKPATQDN